jgi:tetratricopeptide (TPR) repeat protein
MTYVEPMNVHPVKKRIAQDAAGGPIAGRYRLGAAMTVIVACFILSVQAEAAKTFSVPHFDRYKECVREVSIDAKQAYENASRWRAQGGGASAMHCEALALTELRVFPSAAKLLERLARLKEVADPVQKAEIFAQAGHAWILADRSKKARGAFDAGLKLVGLEAYPLIASEMMVGRAHAYSLDENWRAAEGELNHVLEFLPQQFDALLLRASIQRAQGNYGAAASDLANYLTLLPDEVDGLLERGLLKLDIHDLSGAREDFEKVMELAPESYAARQAQGGLSKIAFRRQDADGS